MSCMAELIAATVVLPRRRPARSTPRPRPATNLGDCNRLEDLTHATRKVRLMHLLERIAAAFNRAGLPLMVLKGAALSLTIYRRPHERPMDDLDLLIRPEHLEQANALLEGLGCLHGQPLVREDFFPRYYYETEYHVGQIYPIKIDLHVRPWRPLRYARLVPPNALWNHADTVRIGRATVLIPSTEDMLIHLATHCAVHGHSRKRWLEDLVRWSAARETRINWERFLETVAAWRLALPVREAFERARLAFGPICPATVAQKLAKLRVSWRDRLVLRQAPRDRNHPNFGILVNAVCTPGWRFTLGYLLAVGFPSRAHIGQWYWRRHRGWLACAHLLRWLTPVIKRVPKFWTRLIKVETRRSPLHGVGVFANREIQPGELIARYRARRVQHDGPYVVWRTTEAGQTRHYEITGTLKYLNHSCRPNAELSRTELVACKHIRAGQEVTISYGDGYCSCKSEATQESRPPQTSTKPRVA